MGESWNGDDGDENRSEADKNAENQGDADEI